MMLSGRIGQSHKKGTFKSDLNAVLDVAHSSALSSSKAPYKDRDFLTSEGRLHAVKCCRLDHKNTKENGKC